MQEEIGCRGALVLSRRLENDLAIVLETARANDLGDVKPEDRICMLGGGAVVAQMSRTSISHGALRAAIEQIAEKAGIPWQKLCGVQPASDMGRLQFGALAKPAASIAIPCRGSHSGNCILRRSDIAAQSALVNALLDTLPEIYNDLTQERGAAGMMKDTLLEMLKPFGPSGSERAIREKIAETVRPYVDELFSDAMGNLIAVKRGTGEGRRVMFSAHMDTIGLMVYAADEKGFLRVTPLARRERGADGRAQGRLRKRRGRRGFFRAAAGRQVHDGPAFHRRRRGN